MRKVVSVLAMLMLGMNSIIPCYAEVQERSEQSKYEINESLRTDEASDIMSYGVTENGGKKYSFVYDFKNYVNVSSNINLDKASKISIHLNTTNSGGEKKIYFIIYERKLFGGKEKAILEFNAKGSYTQTIKLPKGGYSCRIRKAKNSKKIKHVIGSGYLK
ncbi:MAG: hypothetical protein PHT76_08425 [Anaerostipes sp.]|nr:hypothetical protein [Anaerostipes sp.]